MYKHIIYLIITVLAFLFGYTAYSKDLKMKEEANIKVIIYSKATCSYCRAAKKLLDNKLIPYKNIDITFNKELHRKLEKETGQSTVPYIFIKKRFIGGYSQLKPLEQDGELLKLIQS